MGSVGTDVSTAVASLPEAAENAVTTLYRHDCAKEDGYGDKCPKRWSKFASHEDDQAYLQNSIKSDPIIHRHFFNKDDKKCLYSQSLLRFPSKVLVHRWTLWSRKQDLRISGFVITNSY